MKLTMQSGIPQGSPMSPILFFIFASPMLETLNDTLKYKLGKELTIASYVDDTYLLVTSSSYKNNMFLLNDYFKIILDWADENEVAFEPSKHELLHFEKPRARGHCQMPLKVGTLEIKPSPKMKILGIVVDSRLTWEDQVTEVRIS